MTTSNDKMLGLFYNENTAGAMKQKDEKAFGINIQKAFMEQ